MMSCALLCCLSETKVNAEIPKDVIAAIASALSSYYVEPTIVVRQGRTGQDRVRCYYSWERIVSKIEDVYKDVVK